MRRTRLSRGRRLERISTSRKFKRSTPALWFARKRAASSRVARSCSLKRSASPRAAREFRRSLRPSNAAPNELATTKHSSTTTCPRGALSRRSKIRSAPAKKTIKANERNAPPSHFSSVLARSSSSRSTISRRPWREARGLSRAPSSAYAGPVQSSSSGCAQRPPAPARDRTSSQAPRGSSTSYS